MAYDVQLIDGDIPAVTTHITGVDLVAQRITVRLNLALGNYLGDQSKGLDYLGFQDRPQDIDAIGAQIRATIEDTPSVDRLNEFTGERVDQTLRYTAIVVVETDTQAETDLLALSVDIPSSVVGNSQLAIVTYHRTTRIAPL